MTKKYTKIVKVVKEGDIVSLESSDGHKWQFGSCVNAENAMVLLLASTMQAIFENKTLIHDQFEIEIAITEYETS